MEGRTIEQKRRLVEEITRITVEVLGGLPQSVQIPITDVKTWRTGPPAASSGPNPEVER